MKKVLALVLLVAAVFFGYTLYQNEMGPNRLVVVEYHVQPGDTQLSIGEHFANEAFPSNKVIYESSNYRGIIQPQAYTKIKIVTTHSRYQELVNQGEKIKLLVD